MLVKAYYFYCHAIAFVDSFVGSFSGLNFH